MKNPCVDLISLAADLLVSRTLRDLVLEHHQDARQNEKHLEAAEELVIDYKMVENYLKGNMAL